MKRLIGLFFLIAWMMQGCVSSASPKPSLDCRSRLTAKEWHLVTVDNDAVKLHASVTFKIDETGRIGGFDGCNSYFGKVKLTDSQITFGPIGSTRKFCRGEAGKTERMLLGFFKGTKWWQIDEAGDLILFDDAHRLIFEPTVQKSGIRD